MGIDNFSFNRVLMRFCLILIIISFLWTPLPGAEASGKKTEETAGRHFFVVVDFDGVSSRVFRRSRNKNWQWAKFKSRMNIILGKIFEEPFTSIPSGRNLVSFILHSSKAEGEGEPASRLFNYSFTGKLIEKSKLEKRFFDKVRKVYSKISKKKRKLILANHKDAFEYWRKNSKEILNSNKNDEFVFKDIVLIHIFDGNTGYGNVEKYNDRYSFFEQEKDLSKNSSKNLYTDKIYVDFYRHFSREYFGGKTIFRSHDKNVEPGLELVARRILGGKIETYLKDNIGIQTELGKFGIYWAISIGTDGRKVLGGIIEPQAAKKKKELLIIENAIYFPRFSQDIIPNQGRINLRCRLVQRYSIKKQVFEIVLSDETRSYSLKTYNDGNVYPPGYKASWFGAEPGKPLDENDLRKYLKSLGGDEFEISITAVSEAFKRQAEREVIMKWLMVVILLAFIVLVIFLYQLITNKRLLSREIHAGSLPINIQVSENRRAGVDLATIKFLNTGKKSAGIKKKKEFDICMKVGVSLKSNPGTLQLKEGGTLLDFKMICGGKSRSLIPVIKESVYILNCPNVYFGDTLEIILNTDVMDDFQTGRNELNKISIPLELEIDGFSAEFSHEKRKKTVPLHQDFAESWEHSFSLELVPEQPVSPSYRLHDLQRIEKGNLEISYSTKKNIVPIFELTVTNRNKHMFSLPVTRTITWHVCEIGQDSTPGPTYPLVKMSGSGIETAKREYRERIEVACPYQEHQSLFFYLDMEQIKENPLHPRTFLLKVFSDGKLIGHCERYITVTRSEEETEALIGFYTDPDLDRVKRTCPDAECKLVYNTGQQLVINENTPDSLNVELKVTPYKRLQITETFSPTLFSMHFRNGSTTGTGLYRFRIVEKTFIPKENIDEKKSYRKRGKNNSAILINEFGSNEIADNEDSKGEIEFLLNPKRVEIKEQEIEFDVQFKLIIDLFPSGTPGGRFNKTLNVTASVKGYHVVASDALAVDFGTSGIVARRRKKKDDGTVGEVDVPVTFTVKKDILGERHEKTDILDSIILLKEEKEIGTADFIRFSLLSGDISKHPDRCVNSLKLRFLRAHSGIPFPKEFAYRMAKGTHCRGRDPETGICRTAEEKGKGCPRLDEDEKTCTGDYLELTPVMLSAYRNLKRHNLDAERNLDGYRRLLITCPNLFNRYHRKSLEKIAQLALAEPGKNIYRDNIVLLSESDAALFFYLKKESRKRKKGIESQSHPPAKEKIAVIDIGAGTTDISLATVEWKDGSAKPYSIKIERKDGVPFAGNDLDEAIALDIHEILKFFVQNEGGDFLDDLEPGADAFDVESPEEYMKKKNRSAQDKQEKTPAPFCYVKRIAVREFPVGERGNKARESIRAVMWDFKEHILDFKKKMCRSKEEEVVRISLGPNSDTKLFRGNLGSPREFRYTFGDITVDAVLELGSGEDSDAGVWYLEMKYREWLSLPFINQFKLRLQKYIETFFEENDKNVTAVLFGRTSLWPHVEDAVTEVIKGENKVVFGNGDRLTGKSSEMKFAVVEGALQKEVTWESVIFIPQDECGVPGVKYQIGPDAQDPEDWDPKELREGQYVEIDLSNSDVFFLGTKTAMTFISFISGYFQRSSYCDKENHVCIGFKKDTSNLKGDKNDWWEFDILGDKFLKPGKRPEPNILCQKKTGKSKTCEGCKKRDIYSPQRLHFDGNRNNERLPGLPDLYWPLTSPQLVEIDPEDFGKRL